MAADHAQGDDDGHEHGAGDGNDLARAAYCNEPAHQHHNIGDDEGGEDAVYGNGMFHEQERAGGEPLNHERAEHDGGNDVSGHPEGQERDQRAAAYRVVGGFRCGDALHTALAVHFRRLGKAFGLRIGEEGCRTDARSRDDADKRADDGGTDEVHDVARQILERDAALRYCAFLKGHATDYVFNGYEHLRDGE